MLIPLILGVILIFIVYCKKRFTYWEKRDVVTYPTPRIPSGHIRFGGKNMAIYFHDYYMYFKSQKKVHGGVYFMTRPLYIPVHLDVVKQLMGADFDSFTDKGLYVNEDKSPISANLFTLGGARWRKLRTKLSPTFTSGKLKLMFDAMLQCTKPLTQSLEDYSLSGEEFDIKVQSMKYTMDVIGCTVFGLECNSFVNPDSDFIKYGTKFVSTTTFQAIKIPFALAMPKLNKFLGISILESDVNDFYTRIVTETVQYRDENQIKRNDFINLMMELRNMDDANKRFSLKEIISESSLFFIAGFETSSTTMSHCLFELAQRQDIQDKLRDEILEVLKKSDGVFTYENVNEMKYLQQVIDETLRMHPAVGIINRACTKDCQINGTNTIIEKGTLISIPVYSIQRDPEYYPNPEKFDPDRFSDENVKARHQYSFLAFGQGPRLCIGQRFGYLQTKLGVASLLSKYRFKLGPNIKLPLEYHRGILLNPSSKISLVCEQIN